MQEILLRGRGIVRDFDGNRVLNGVDIDVAQGDFTVIMGASGAGKSTLLYALSGMDGIDGGEVLYRDRSVSRLSERETAKLHASEFGFVFQQTHLVSDLTLRENVLAAGFLTCDDREARKRADALLRRMNVQDAADRLPSQVSGGEAQRAAIARALINRPSVLFADEPTGALNRAHSTEVLDLLSSVHADGQSILMVTHDVRAAARGTRIVYLEDGAIGGEKTLPVFEPAQAREREAMLNDWLLSLRW